MAKAKDKSKRPAVKMPQKGMPPKAMHDMGNGMMMPDKEMDKIWEARYPSMKKTGKKRGK